MNVPSRIASLALTTVLAFAAFVGAPRAEDDGITVGFSTIILADQFFVRLQKGMDDAAARLGVKMILDNPERRPDGAVQGG